MIQDKTQDEQILQYERYLTNHDTLTGLYNKYYFFDRAQNYLQKNNSGEYLLVSIKLANHGFLTEVFGKYMIDNFIIKLSKEISSKFESKSVYGRIREDNFAILIQKEKFDIVFLDPPYAEVFLENSLKMITEIDILQSGGIIVTERPLGKELSFDCPGYTRSKDYKYSKTILTIYRKD